MKFIYNILQLLFVSFICSCCQVKKEGMRQIAEPQDYLSITDTVIVSSKHCSIPQLKPRNMLISNGHLVVANETKGYAFSVFPLPYNGEGFNAVHYGKGPGELISPDFLSITTSSDGFWVADKDNFIKSYRILNDDVVFVDNSRIFNKSLQNGYFKIGDLYLNVNDDRKNNNFEYVALKPDGNKVFIGDVPDWDADVTPDNSLLYYWNYRIVHPDGKRFAEFFWRYRKVRILDDNGHALTETSINYPTSWERVPDSEGIYLMYGGIPCTSKTRIVQFAENAYVRRTNGKIEPRTTSEYQIWDWEGHLLRRFIVKEHVELFTVDFKTGTFYGIDPAREDVIFTADISNLL